MPKAKRMTKDEAVREARIGSKLKGGTWYVTRRGDNYGVQPADMYDSGRHGKIAETIDILAERMAKMAATAEIKIDLSFSIQPATDDSDTLYTIKHKRTLICYGQPLEVAVESIRTMLENYDE